jgi:ERCC4-type nuclease
MKGDGGIKEFNVPWTMIIDNREQEPWTFEDIVIGTGKERRQIILPTMRGTLRTGDYSIRGYEKSIAIERKSKADLFGTIGSSRDRFVRELSRLNMMDWAAVIIECEWFDAMKNPPERSQMHVSAIDGSINAWMQRFPRVHWLWRPGRYVSSKVCFKVLHRFWEDHCDAK